MRVYVQLFFGLEEFSSIKQKKHLLTVDGPCTVLDVVKKLALPEEPMLILVNEKVSSFSAEVNSEDHLKFFPWLAGG